MPADNGQPEAKTDVAQNIGFHAILGVETAVFSHFLDVSPRARRHERSGSKHGNPPLPYGRGSDKWRGFVTRCGRQRGGPAMKRILLAIVLLACGFAGGTLMQLRFAPQSEQPPPKRGGLGSG
jgi:hypothetical protein